MVGKTLASILALTAMSLMIMIGWLSFSGSKAPAFASDMTRVVISEEAANQFDMKVGVLFAEAAAYNDEQAKNARMALTQEEITAKIASLSKFGVGPVPIRDVQVNLRADRIFLTGYVDVPLSAVQIGAIARVETLDGKSQIEVDEISFGSIPLPDFAKDLLTDYILSVNLAEVGPPATLENARIENSQLVLEGRKH